MEVSKQANANSDSMKLGYVIPSLILGGMISGYSYELRELAQAGKLNYSYIQGVGIHWGVGMMISSYYNLYGELPKKFLPVSIAIGSWMEISTSLEGGTFALEDIVGYAGGAVIGAYLPHMIKKTYDLFCNSK